MVHRDLKPANVLISNHHYRNLVTTEEHNKVFQDKPIICKLCDFGESRSMLKQTKSIACTRTNAVTRGTLAYMAPELLHGDMLLQSASLSDYKMTDIWSLGMTLFCILYPDLGSPVLIEWSETGFDVHRNIGESLSEIILKNKRPNSSTKYQSTLINHWLNMWSALNHCLEINPYERSSLDNVLIALTSNMVPYIKSLSISQALVLNALMQR